MNILITLPNELIEKIISGEKKFEMRKCMPSLMKLGKDGFFVVEKGTDEVRCWCRVDAITMPAITKETAEEYSKDLCVSPQYILNYVSKGPNVYLWEIGKVKVLQDLIRDSLFVGKNPQQFAYYDKLCDWQFDRDFKHSVNMLWLDIEKILPKKD